MLQYRLLVFLLFFDFGCTFSLNSLSLWFTFSSSTKLLLTLQIKNKTKLLTTNLQPRDAFYTSSSYLPLIILFPSQFSIFHYLISLFLSQIDYLFKLFNVVSTHEHSNYNPPHHPQQIILVWY